MEKKIATDTPLYRHDAAYARQLDEERYKDERTVPLSELNKQDKE